MLYFLLGFSGGWSGSVEEIGQIDYIPLQRCGSKLEMAHAVVFLVSDCCPYITGISFVVLQKFHTYVLVTDSSNLLCHVFHGATATVMYL